MGLSDDLTILLHRHSHEDAVREGLTGLGPVPSKGKENPETVTVRRLEVEGKREGSPGRNGNFLRICPEGPGVTIVPGTEQGQSHHTVHRLSGEGVQSSMQGEPVPPVEIVRLNYRQSDRKGNHEFLADQSVPHGLVVGIDLDHESRQSVGSLEIETDVAIGIRTKEGFEGKTCREIGSHRACCGPGGIIIENSRRLLNHGIDHVRSRSHKVIHRHRTLRSHQRPSGRLPVDNGNILGHRIIA